MRPRTAATIPMQTRFKPTANSKWNLAHADFRLKRFSGQIHVRVDGAGCLASGNSVRERPHDRQRNRSHNGNEKKATPPNDQR